VSIPVKKCENIDSNSFFNDPIDFENVSSKFYSGICKIEKFIGVLKNVITKNFKGVFLKITFFKMAAIVSQDSRNHQLPANLVSIISGVF
jgi:hypothetical protein